MRVKTLEIRWHDGKPIYSCDFQRRAVNKNASTSTGSSSATNAGATFGASSTANVNHQAYRFATAGADTHVRIWLIHPTNPTALASADQKAQKGPKAEYLSTLSKHAGAVNVVRWSPNGEYLASAADDGMLIIWTKDDKPGGSSNNWGRDPSESALDQEHWKALVTVKVTAQEVYDLAWSPTGEYILTGSTDNTARIWTRTGQCLKEITDHSHYVQGVAWDPMNEYIATQSSDRSVRLYRVTTKQGIIETHPLRQNTHMAVRHSRTPSSHSRAASVSRASTSAITGSATRPRHTRRSSITSEAESIGTTASDFFGPTGSNSASALASFVFGSSTTPNQTGNSRDSQVAPLSLSTNNINMVQSADAPLTPAASVASTGANASGIFVPPKEKTLSRRSSISGISNTPGSPLHSAAPSVSASQSHRSVYGRSPSPMPPLPAIRAPPANTWAAMRLYGDENVTNFFRRLTFSPDGGLLVTPAGHYEDSSVISGSRGTASVPDDPPAIKQRRGREADPAPVMDSTSSCAYVYSRANFSRPPVAALPGHKKASVCVKFSPILYELRQGVIGPGMGTSTGNSGNKDVLKVDLEPGGDVEIEVKALNGSEATDGVIRRPSSSSSARATIAQQTLPSPALSAIDGHAPQTPAAAATPSASGGGATGALGTGSVFALPYRMMFAVATQDTVMIHDTQQAGPICMFAKLHYDSFTDMAWSHDGQVLMLVSSDGYCTIVVFEEDMPLHNVQQHHLQLQSIALAHSHALITPSSSHGSNTYTSSNVGYNQSVGSLSPTTHTTYLPPIAQSPAVSVKDLPGPSTGSSVGLAMGATGATTHNPLKRPAPDAPPLTPAASVIDEDIAMSIGVHGAGGLGLMSASSSGASLATISTDNGGEPAKKKRRVELTHHGSTQS